MTAVTVKNASEALAFVRRHGIVLMTAAGPVPSLAEAIAGGPIRGSWWAHPRARQIFRVLEAVRASQQILVCRLVQGKLTLIHRRLWPALVRAASRLPKAGLAAVREEHTASGRHRAMRTAFPGWVPKPVAQQALLLDLAEAIRLLGPAVPRTAARAPRP